MIDWNVPITIAPRYQRHLGPRDGQRVAVGAIGEHELALVIGAPQIVRRVGARERRPLRLVDTPAAALDQAMPIQDRVHGTDRRTLHLGVLAAQPFADLRSTPDR